MKAVQDGIQNRSFAIALRVIRLIRHIPTSRDGDILARQHLKSGMSIGANVEEATAGFSMDDFIFKMSTALKEARESHYWLRLIRDAEVMTPNRLAPVVQEAEEIKNILGAIVRSSRKS